MSAERLADIRQAAERQHEVATTATVVGTTPPRVDLTVYQGDDFYLTVTVTQTTPPIDLTTYTPKAEIRAQPGAATVIATFVATIVDPLTVGLHLPHAQSALLAGNASWDLQITDPAGVVTTVAYGSVSVTKDVTR